jgi:hypothetical protein
VAAIVTVVATETGFTVIVNVPDCCPDGIETLAGTVALLLFDERATTTLVMLVGTNVERDTVPVMFWPLAGSEELRPSPVRWSESTPSVANTGSESVIQAAQLAVIVGVEALDETVKVALDDPEGIVRLAGMVSASV